MPKLRRLLSVFLALWLCVMLVAFTYTWVSRNWAPSIKSDEIDIASAGALIISVMGDDSHTEVLLNDIVNIPLEDSFTFRQVSSQDGKTFFRKDFFPTLQGLPAKFEKVEYLAGQKNDYIEAEFCLKLDKDIPDSKYIFIHPDTAIEYKYGNQIRDLNKAIRISLTFTPKNGQETTIILADLDDLGESDPGLGGGKTEEYQAVLKDANGKTDEEDSGALGNLTVYDLHYFDCGRTSFDTEDKWSAFNYDYFTRNGDRALFTMTPGDTVWVTMRIWLEGQDANCEKEIAGETFNMTLKFDSAYVTPQQQ